LRLDPFWWIILLMRRLLGVSLALVLALGATAAEAGPARAGRFVAGSAPSPALGADIAYNVYLPFGYERTSQRYPVLYLLHGRGDSMAAWTRVKAELDRLIATGQIPPVLAVLPDAPWNSGGSYYVDSAHTGGVAAETALTRDLVTHVDSTYRTVASRSARLVGGYSMGGYGALRYVLAHQDLFAQALVLSPAVYTPLPPADAAAREFGAFGRGATLFDDAVYTSLNYPALLPGLDPALPVRMYIAVGDDEWANPLPEDYRHDIDFESAALYNLARRSPAVTADLRVVDGGHDWDVWAPAFVDGMRSLGPALGG
jgi:enterochelin esterase-like enzyme